jgi:hypothetical protein
MAQVRPCLRWPTAIPFRSKVMKTVRIYHNGGKTADRYTAVFMAQPQGRGLYSGISMSERPFHPQGGGQHCSAMPGRHLGRRIALAALPADCQMLVMRDLQSVALGAT